MECWKREWEINYEKDFRSTNKQLIKLKAQVEKQKSKIVPLEISVEINKENIAKQEDIIKDLQERVKHLELEQRLGFKELRNRSSPIPSIGSFEYGHVTYKEEDTVQQHIEQHG